MRLTTWGQIERVQIEWGCTFSECEMSDRLGEEDGTVLLGLGFFADSGLPICGACGEDLEVTAVEIGPRKTVLAKEVKSGEDTYPSGTPVLVLSEREKGFHEVQINDGGFPATLIVVEEELA